MIKNQLNWLTGKRLMERWDIDVFELGQFVFELNLPVYDSNYQKQDEFVCRTPEGEEGLTGRVIYTMRASYSQLAPLTNNLYLLHTLINDLNDYNESEKDKILNSLFFKLDDVMRFEENGRKNNGLSAKKDAQELGRLKREKSGWDDSIKAAVKIGIFCNQLSTKNIEITKNKLTDEIYKLGYKDLPKTTIEKIWKAIPEKYRKKAGRPAKEKK
nr:hypothetical protein 7 [Desulfobacteraceae bacterium]